MPSEDVFKVSLFYHTSQRQMIATHYYEVGIVTTVDPFEEAQALAEAFDTIFTTTYRLALSQGVQLGCLKVEQVKGLGIPTYVLFYSNLGGLVAGDAMPANIPAIIRRRGIFAAKTRRSLLFLGGVSAASTTGSFLTSAYVSGPLTTLLNLYNNGLVAGSEFNLAQFGPVIPVTGHVYARDVPVTKDLALNTMTLTDGTSWSARGFVTGGQFRIAAPSRNKGTYTATVVALNATITLSDNELETSAAEVLSCQQVITPTQYITLQSATANTALRQLSRRRSSHTGVVA